MQKYTGLEIAIIGMAGRFPGAKDIKSFWNNLKNGVESIQFFSDEELLQEGEDESTINHPLYVRANGLLDGKEFFDSSFFNYTPDEAKLMDPQMRVFHECVWEALEDAGCNLDDQKNKIGLFAGSASNLNWEAYALFANREEIVNPFSAKFLNNTRFITSRISYNLNLKGPSVFIDTACSTSLVAIHNACRSLLLGDCNIALAGGCSITNKSKKGYLYKEGNIYSKDGHCRVFDAEASGTIDGEGSAVVVLKSLKNALKDGDNIWAIIKGSGINNDGNNKVGYTAPSIDGQSEAIMMAQKWAKVEPESISMIEAHGTGTELGDPIEVEALIRTFGESNTKYCALGSVKSNIGHLDTVAGVAGLVKTVLSLKNKQIPPSLHYKKSNPKISFDNSPFFVNTELREWKNNGHPLRAGVSSFGIGGTNAHVILEEAPIPELASQGRKYQLLTFSGKSPSSLKRNMERFSDYFASEQQEDLADIAYTLQVGRAHFPYRRAVVCQSCSEAVELLSPELSANNARSSNSTPSIVFMFSGQGSQYRNMYYDLYQEEKVFRDTVDQCFKIITQLSGNNLSNIVFSKENSREATLMDQTEYTQPILFTVEYALARLILSWGVKVELMIGHSIGEYVAACTSGVFSLEDALSLVIKRGELMQKVEEGSMLSISISEKELLPLIKNRKDLSLAAVNSSTLCVVAGKKQDIEAFKKTLDKLEYVNKPIRTSHAFHSYMMDEILEEFKNEVNKVQINPIQIPLISNLTGEVMEISEVIRPEYWVQHLRGTVRFSDGIELALQEKNVIFLEVGPGNGLSSFVRGNIYKSTGHQVINLVKRIDSNDNDLLHLMTALGKFWSVGGDLNWNAFYNNENRKKVSLPTYSFEKVRYPIDVDAYKLISENYSKSAASKNISEYFYTPAWQITSIPVKPFSEEENDILLFSDNSLIAEGLTERLSQHKLRLFSVKKGSTFKKISSYNFEINPSSEVDYTQLLKSIGFIGKLRILFLWGINYNSERIQCDSKISEMRTVLDNSYYSILNLSKALSDLSIDAEITSITSNVHCVINGDKAFPENAPLLAALKVIPKEYSNIKCCSIDIDANCTDTLDVVFNDWVGGIENDIIAYRMKTRFVQTVKQMKLQKGKDEIPFKSGSVYLITGGTGGMGNTFASKIAQGTPGVKFILLGRRDLPKKEEWKEYLQKSDKQAPLYNAIASLQEIEDRGGEVFYLNSDITDKYKLEIALAEAETRTGAIKGVIHAAGVADFGGIIHTRSKESSEEIFAAKVYGTLILNEILANHQLDFFVLCSSLSATAAPAGEVAYVAANQFLDSYAISKNSGSTGKFLSIGWNAWVDVGMAVKASKKNTGFDFYNSISSSQGFDVLVRGLNSHVPQVIISKVDPIIPFVNNEHGSNSTEEIFIGNENEEADKQRRSDSSIVIKLLSIWKNFFGKAEISYEDDFFEIGGDSLKALTIIGRINKAFNVNISITEFFNNSSINALVKYIIDENDKTLLPETFNSSFITKVELKEYYPLSSAQKRLYFLYEFDKDSLTYNIPEVWQLEGDLDKKKLDSAFHRLVQRHESLRTIFFLRDGVPVQKILDTSGIGLQYYQCPDGDVPSIIKTFIHPFNLNEGPVIRVGIIEVSCNKYILLVDRHHIVSDGISLGIFMRDFLGLYSNQQLPELKAQYKDYAVWQVRESLGEDIYKQKEFWFNEFSEEPANLELPTDFARPLVQTQDGDRIEFEISAELAAKLKSIAITEGTTMFNVLFAIYNIFLAKLSNNEDIVVGTPVSGRKHEDLENIVGMFVNTLAIRNLAQGELTFKEFLAKVKSKTLACFYNQDYQFEELVEELEFKRDISRNTLFNVVFSFNSNDDVVPETEDLKITSLDSGLNVSKFDLTLFAKETGNHLYLYFEYSTALFKMDTISRFISYFRNVVDQVIQGKNSRLSEIELLSDMQKQKLLLDFNDTEVHYNSHLLMHQMFEQQAMKHPENTAIISEGIHYSYKWLNTNSNQLGNYLKGKGVKHETSVALIMERKVELIVALFAILKAGGKYVPIEYHIPENRKVSILNSVGAEMIITSNSYLSETLGLREKAVSASHIFVLETHNQTLQLYEANPERFVEKQLYNYPIEDLQSDTTSDDLAYVIFTSGSTGQPKGVAVKHKPVINLIEWVNKTYKVGREDKILMVSSISFDLSVYDIFGGLAAGAAVRIATYHELEDPEVLAEIVVNEGITFWDSAPAMLQQIVPFLEKTVAKSDKVPKLRLSFSSGDWIPLGLVTQMKKLFSNYRFISLGGATEATVWSNYYEVNEVDPIWNSIPYGKPIQNAKYLILDKDLNLCDVGIQGDLYIGGQCLANCYINDKELTDRKFIPSPFYKGEMLYNTGDTAKWFSDGNIEFLGRKDTQIKIRGYRIELGEIESKTLMFPRIYQALADVIERSKYDKSVCLYYVSDDPIPESVLKEFLNKELPVYMLPQYFIHLKSIPMTKNGKVDRKKLPSPVLTNSSEFKELQSDTERSLAELWASILHVEQSDIYPGSNFFEIGGHSLLAVNLIYAIQQKFQVNIKLRDIFIYSTIEKLAVFIKRLNTEQINLIPQVESKDFYAVSPAQARLFYVQFLNEDNKNYNISSAYTIKGRLNLDWLKDAFQVLVGRHPSLRTSFELSDQHGLIQKISPYVEFQLERIDGTIYKSVEEAYDAFVRPFNMFMPSLFRVGLMENKDFGQVVFVDIHHIICDGVSLNILMNDFKSIYQGKPLPVLRYQYVDYVYWQINKETALGKQREFWKNKLSGVLPILDLPVIQSRDSVDVNIATMKVLHLKDDIYKNIKNTATKANVSDYIFLLSAYYVLLFKVTGSHNIIIGTDAIGRTNPGLMDIVGTFINLIPIRLTINNENNYSDFLEEVKESVLEAFENQDFQFDQMVSMINETGDPGKSFFNVHFSFANYYDKSSGESESLFEPLIVTGDKTTDFEFKLEVQEVKNEFQVLFIFSKELYDESTIDLLMNYYLNIIISILSNQSLSIKEIEMENLQLVVKK